MNKSSIHAKPKSFFPNETAKVNTMRLISSIFLTNYFNQSIKENQINSAVNYNFIKYNRNNIAHMDSKATHIINSYFYSLNSNCSREHSHKTNNSGISSTNYIYNSSVSPYVVNKNSNIQNFYPDFSYNNNHMKAEDYNKITVEQKKETFFDSDTIKIIKIVNFSSNKQNKIIIISKPIFNHTNSGNKVTIELYYYIPSYKHFSTIEINNIGINALTQRRKYTYSTKSENYNQKKGYSKNYQYFIVPDFFVNDSSIINKNIGIYKTVLNSFIYSDTIEEKLASVKNQWIDNHIITIKKILEQIYNKEVSLIIIRTYYPYINSYILAQYIAHNTHTNRFVRLRNKIFSKTKKAIDITDTSFRSHITGLKIQISGRITTEKVIPRKTVKYKVLGSLNPSMNAELKGPFQQFKFVNKLIINSNNHTIITTGFEIKPNNITDVYTLLQSRKTLFDYNKITNKNRLGAFSVKVWIASNISGF